MPSRALEHQRASCLCPQVPAVLPQAVPGVRVALSAAGPRKRRRCVGRPPRILPALPDVMKPPPTQKCPREHRIPLQPGPGGRRSGFQGRGVHVDKRCARKEAPGAVRRKQRRGRCALRGEGHRGASVARLLCSWRPRAAGGGGQPGPGVSLRPHSGAVSKGARLVPHHGSIEAAKCGSQRRVRTGDFAGPFLSVGLVSNVHRWNSEPPSVSS